jgi:NAD(P)-dependent dehydrogenase (short-subunit alcohol dehydrogenase family)
MIIHMSRIHDLFNIAGQVAVITGGAGVIGAHLSLALAAEEIKVAVLDIDLQAAEAVAGAIKRSGGEAIAMACDVCDKSSLAAAADKIMEAFSRVDVLLNAAGGNSPRATTSDEVRFFDLPDEALHGVIELNLLGTMLSCQVFGVILAEQQEGVILNISSMNALRPLTRIAAYSAAKAAVSNFTQWLAVHMAQEYSPQIRVNAIAPGFFLTSQNHYLLMDKEGGALTDRGQTIIAHTPMRRFGDPEDLVGVALWLLSPASRFVTGIVVPVDGGFSAFSGV